MDLWYPHGVRDPAPPALWGAHAPGYAPKIVLHTTEGRLGVYIPDTRRGDARRYFGHTYWPTYTLALGAPVVDGRWHVYQHIPANRSARALANASGGVETNRANVSQVEIAWKAGQIASLPGEALDELARLLAWEHEVRGVPIESRVRWVGSDGYGADASQRLSGRAWNAYAGVLGHQHATENDHWDPGRFPVQALLSRARELAAGEEAVDVAVVNEVATRVNEVLARDMKSLVTRDETGAEVRMADVRIGSVGQAVGLLVLRSSETARRLERLAAGRIEELAGDVGDPDELDRLSALLAARADELRRPGG